MIDAALQQNRDVAMSEYPKIMKQLEEKLSQLVVRAKEIDEDLSDPADDDWEERATEMEDDEVLLSVGNVALKEINQIKQALHQIESGTYGKCVRCGVQIPEERLELLPYATTCTKCRPKSNIPATGGRSYWHFPTIRNAASG